MKSMLYFQASVDSQQKYNPLWWHQWSWQDRVRAETRTKCVKLRDLSHSKYFNFRSDETRAKRAQLPLTSQEMLGSKNKNFTSYRPPTIGHNTMGLVHSSPFLHTCACLHTRPIYTYTSNFKTRKAYQVQLGGGGYQRHRLL